MSQMGRNAMCSVAVVVLGLWAYVGMAQQTQPAHDHARHGAAEAHHARMFQHVNHGVAVLAPTAGNQARGVAHFYEQDGKVRVVVEMQGLNPNQQHAIHVHEFGDITAPDGTSAGSHYNPEGHPHGLPDSSPRHAGDFGNLQADAEGKAKLELTVDNLSVAGMKNPVIGRAVVVHAGADKGTQPVGDAGGRIAVGVIGIAKPAP